MLDQFVELGFVMLAFGALVSVLIVAWVVKRYFDDEK